jgi:hypothetical protein
MFTWLKQVRAKSARPTARRSPRARLELESLEDRLALHAVAYHNGFIIPHVQVQAIYYGSWWLNNTTGWSQSQRMDTFFQSITQSAYLSQLGEYSDNTGAVVGTGSFGTDDHVTTNIAGATLTDADIRSLIRGEISGGWVPAVNHNTLYFVFTPPGVVVKDPWGTPNTAPAPNGWYAEHSNGANGLYYAVVPYSAGDYFHGVWTSAFDMMTWSSAHELAEACTDPGAPAGWYNNVSGSEIGDIGDNIYPAGVVYNNYRVSALWSNVADAAIMPSGAYAAGGVGPVGGSGQSGPPGARSNAAGVTQVLLPVAYGPAADAFWAYYAQQQHQHQTNDFDLLRNSFAA